MISMSRIAMSFFVAAQLACLVGCGRDEAAAANLGNDATEAGGAETFGALVTGCPADDPAGGRGFLIIDENKAAAAGAWYQQANANAVNGAFKFITRSGSLDIPFQGICATVTALKCVNCGKMNIKVDGVLRATVDLYSPSDVWRADVYSTGTLLNGNHAITVEWTGSKNASSTNTTVTFDALRVDPGGSASPEGGVAKSGALIFKSNFGTGVTLSAPSKFFPTGTGAWRDITGTDSETKFTWPPKLGGLNYTGLQIITKAQITPATIDNFYEAGIRQIPERVWPQRELYQINKDPGIAGDCCDQIPLMWSGGWKSGDVKEIYISYWFKHQADLEEQLKAGGWRVQFEFKTGGYNNTGGGDYRIGTSIVMRDGKPAWITISDNNANGLCNGANDPDCAEFWRKEEKVVPVPIDKWFKYEVYWKRSNGTDGRFWTAVDGNVIVDRFGPNMGALNLPINRVMLNNAYAGGKNPTQSRTTGLEIWGTWPCGVGISCYGK